MKKQVPKLNDLNKIGTKSLLPGNKSGLVEHYNEKEEFANRTKKYVNVSNGHQTSPINNNNKSSINKYVTPHVSQSVKRIFVNRSLHMEKIRFFGFDMDYTLAVYKSPQYETLAFDLTKQRLVDIGYPEELLTFTYDPSFPVRGLWFDKTYGTLLKLDQFGNIFFCIRGFHFLSPSETRRLYPNKFMQLDENRIYVLNTLFHLPEMFVLACVIHWFTNNPDYALTDKGVKKGAIFMSYKCIFQDVRSATDWIHREGGLKKHTVENFEKYVQLDERLPLFLDRIRSTGAKTFLLTNSDFQYSQSVMSYILSTPNSKGKIPDWTTYFDFIVVNAKKPSFFQQGSLMRAVDRYSGHLSFGYNTPPAESGKLYSGGSCECFSEMIGARGKDVLYVGDHIFGDILKSKKIVGWRTYLVIPELANEIYVWKKERKLFEKLQRLDNYLADAYRNLNISSDAKPDVGVTRQEIRNVARNMEEAYGGILGSLFRNGTRHTFFSSQVLRYADVYSSSYLNLMHYPLCFMFRSPSMLMPHESTVSHVDSPFDPVNDIMTEAINSGVCRRKSNLLTSPSNELVTGSRRDLCDSDLELETTNEPTAIKTSNFKEPIQPHCSDSYSDVAIPDQESEENLLILS